MTPRFHQLIDWLVVSPVRGHDAPSGLLAHLDGLDGLGEGANLVDLQASRSESKIDCESINQSINQKSTCRRPSMAGGPNPEHQHTAGTPLQLTTCSPTHLEQQRVAGLGVDRLLHALGVGAQQVVAHDLGLRCHTRGGGGATKHEVRVWGGARQGAGRPLWRVLAPACVLACVPASPSLSLSPSPSR